MSAQDVRQKAQALLEEGAAYYERGRLYEALSCWKRVLTLDPDNRAASEYLRFIEDHFQIGVDALIERYAPATSGAKPPPPPPEAFKNRPMMGTSEVGAEPVSSDDIEALDWSSILDEDLEGPVTAPPGNLPEVSDETVSFSGDEQFFSELGEGSLRPDPGHEAEAWGARRHSDGRRESGPQAQVEPVEDPLQMPLERFAVPHGGGGPLIEAAVHEAAVHEAAVPEAAVHETTVPEAYDPPVAGTAMGAAGVQAAHGSTPRPRAQAPDLWSLVEIELGRLGLDADPDEGATTLNVNGGAAESIEEAIIQQAGLAAQPALDEPLVAEPGMPTPGPHASLSHAEPEMDPLAAFESAASLRPEPEMARLSVGPGEDDETVLAFDVSDFPSEAEATRLAPAAMAPETPVPASPALSSPASVEPVPVSPATPASAAPASGPQSDPPAEDWSEALAEEDSLGGIDPRLTQTSDDIAALFLPARHDGTEHDPSDPFAPDQSADGFVSSPASDPFFVPPAEMAGGPKPARRNLEVETISAEPEGPLGSVPTPVVEAQPVPRREPAAPGQERAVSRRTGEVIPLQGRPDAAPLASAPGLEESMDEAEGTLERELAGFLAEPAPTPGPDEAPRPNPEKMLRQVRMLFASGDYSGCRELAGEMLTIWPDHLEASQLEEDASRRLLEVMRNRLGPLTHCPQVLMGPDQIIWQNMDHRAGFLFSQADGMTSYEDIIAISGMTELEATNLLLQLVELNVIG